MVFYTATIFFLAVYSAKNASNTALKFFLAVYIVKMMFYTFLIFMTMV